MRVGGLAAFSVWVGCGVGTAAEPAKDGAKANVPAPLIHDKRIHGQTVKIEAGGRLEVRVSGGCFWNVVALGGDSIGSDKGREPTEFGRDHVFGFKAERPGRTRVVMAKYGPGGKAENIEFTAEVTGPGKPTAPADVPLFLFDGADGETFNVAVGRKIECRLRLLTEGGAWKVRGIEGKAVRDDTDPKAKDAGTVFRFTAAAAGRSEVTIDWTHPTDRSLKRDVTIRIDVEPAGKGLSPEAF